MYQKYAELISLGLTVPTILLSAWVVRLYWQPAIEALKAQKRTSVQWFAIGIAVGFLGSSLDNLYWSIPWMASYLGMPVKQDMMNAGVFFNIPFRQLCGIVAAYCHIRSVLEFQRAKGVPDVRSRLPFEVVLWMILGTLLVILLGAIRSQIY